MARKKYRDNPIAYRVILPLGLALISLGLFLMILKVFFTRGPSFNITKVTLKGIEPKGGEGFTRKLIGKNIFSQNLSWLKKQSEQEIPDVFCLSIRRKLPGELEIILKKRSAIAQVKFSRFYLIDESGMLMRLVSDTAFTNLPIIYGIEYKAQKGLAGKYYSVGQALNGLKLIQEKNNSSLLNGYTITKIILAKQKASSLFIIENFSHPAFEQSKADLLKPQEVEVKFDLEKPVETVRMLGLLLAKRKNSLSSAAGGKSGLGDIEYIDLTSSNSPVVLERKEKER